MPTGIPKSGINKGWFQKGHPSYLTKESKIKISNSLKGIVPWNKGKYHTKETKEKMSKSHMGKIISLESRKKMSESKKGTKLKPTQGFQKGEKHWNWIGGEMVKRNKRNDPAYCYWVEKVKKRDNRKCKIENEDCSGSMVAHHILPWRDYVKERYDVNNGITLCKYHHPIKKEKEIELIPFFQSLALSNEL